MHELTTSVAGIDFRNQDMSKSNWRMKSMVCAPGDIVELRLQPTTPFDDNAVDRSRDGKGGRADRLQFCAA